MLPHHAVVAAKLFGRSADSWILFGIRPFPAGVYSVQLYIDGRLEYYVLRAVFSYGEYYRATVGSVVVSRNAV